MGLSKVWSLLKVPEENIYIYFETSSHPGENYTNPLDTELSGLGYLW